eukprot:TRINITY_DN2156_c2_g1_i1.p2 TRINITY_DN2156_c2_g1~~TRINITY_DN2156_c2_g1_i1.p2  ORF type:complete len:229 (+),score=-25.14 TRINITY_DN2156_c2_g1_i1:64-687(+)
MTNIVRNIIIPTPQPSFQENHQGTQTQNAYENQSQIRTVFQKILYTFITILLSRYCQLLYLTQKLPITYINIRLANTNLLTTFTNPPKFMQQIWYIILCLVRTKKPYAKFTNQDITQTTFIGKKAQILYLTIQSTPLNTRSPQNDSQKFSKSVYFTITNFNRYIRHIAKQLLCDRFQKTEFYQVCASSLYTGSQLCYYTQTFYYKLN